MHIRPIRFKDDTPPVALILGTGDIASAVARDLFKAGCGVLMLRDAAVPVLRRGMAFDDALENGVADLDGVWAVRAPAPEMVAALVRGREAVVLSRLDLAVVAAGWHGILDILIDARVRKYAAPPDLRPLAACAIGIGPGFVSKENVDIAVETLPGQEGNLVEHGATAAPTGQSVPLGGAREERFAYAVTAGPWDPKVALGAWVEADDTIGWLGQRRVVAPIGGCMRGLVRETPGGVARGSKCAEIDPRVGAPWTGVPPRAQRIAAGVKHAVAAMLPLRPVFGAD
jgi:hypothetical protein